MPQLQRAATDAQSLEGQVLDVAAQLAEVVVKATKHERCCCCSACISNLSVLLQTLAKLHSSGICHMDISPSNIMVQTKAASAWDTIRLIDFGFAKRCDTGLHLCVMCMQGNFLPMFAACFACVCSTCFFCIGHLCASSSNSTNILSEQGSLMCCV